MTNYERAYQEESYRRLDTEVALRKERTEHKKTKELLIKAKNIIEKNQKTAENDEICHEIEKRMAEV